MIPLYQHDPEHVTNELIDWGKKQNSVQIMLMTSTRAVPNASVDRLSDYDIVLIVENIRPFYEDRRWLGDFGEVLVVYWDPIYPDPDTGIEKFGNVTQYADGLKIDFTLYPVAWLQKILSGSTLPAELDAGYRVLLDKQGWTESLKPPTYSAYIPVVPTNEIYQKWIHDFFSDVPYVAKCLWRGELLPLKWCLDYDMKHVYLRQMLEWKIGLDHHWSVPVGALGKGLKKRLPSELWSQLESCYAGAEHTENWEALFRTMALFRQVAIEVGNGLGYSYPLDLDERVIVYVQKMRLLPKV